MTKVDSMQDMPIPNDWTITVEPAAVLALGVRAAWLHMVLASPSGDVLAPRDREILTLVATRPHGVDLSDLTSLLRRLGVTHGAALHWVDRLVGQGWLSRTGDPAFAVIDLPATDAAWVTDQVHRMREDLA